MEIAEVKDRESLRAYLDKSTVDSTFFQIADRLAFRAAARVLPIALNYYLDDYAKNMRQTPEKVFGALTVAGIACKQPSSAVNVTSAVVVRGKAYTEAASAEATNPAAASVARAIGYATAAAEASVVFRAIENATAAAAAFDVDLWEAVRADLALIKDKLPSEMLALWQDLQEPECLSEAWRGWQQEIEVDPSADWSFWILWYERVRAGRDFHADKLAEILNPLSEDDWKKGPAHINPLFDDLLALYREEDAALEAEPTPLSQAYFADFSFDALAKVMVMIGIDNDTAHLRAPEVVQAFLDDSEEVRDLLQDFADDARALSGGNYAGVLQRKAEKLLTEFRRAGETTHLRARTIVTYCGDLELHAQEEKARQDLGQTLSRQLDQRVGLLKRLCLQHFGPAYLALAPLAEMPREHVDQGEVVRLLDLALEQMRAPSQDGFVALDPEGVAVFEEMIRGLEATRAAIAEADSAEFRDLLEARFAQNSGSIGVTALRYFEKSVVAAGRSADALVQANKRVTGLRDVLDRLMDWLPGGGA